MQILIPIALFVFLFWMVRQGKKHAANRAATGMTHDRLHHIANFLMLVLFGLVALIVKMHHHAHVPLYLWASSVVVMIALLLVRRALKYRYGM